MRVLCSAEDKDQTTMIIFETYKEGQDLINLTIAGKEKFRKNTRAYKLAERLERTLECWPV
ncbi:MAG: hypothetical protein COB49_07470 [Alphaproteobacteria bacterium]|nr:MAG: hypothetical protein COB49_07470 [Alphaproteobacteria bacterium]